MRLFYYIYFFSVLRNLKPTAVAPARTARAATGNSTPVVGASAAFGEDLDSGFVVVTAAVVADELPPEVVVCFDEVAVVELLVFAVDADVVRGADDVGGTVTVVVVVVVLLSADGSAEVTIGCSDHEDELVAV